MDLKTSIGKRIKELRKKSGLTQEELSCLVDVYSKIISRIETGVFMPSIDLIYRISKALKIEFKNMFEIEHQQPIEDLLTSSVQILKDLDNDKLKLAFKMLKVLETD